MKSVLNYPKNKKKVKKYPQLAKLLIDGTIVLFNSEHSGTVLKSKDYDIGHHSNNWISINDKDEWEVLPSDCVIKLSND